MSTTSVRASDRVYDYLRQQILTGALLPGEMLGEQQVADAAGVSRTPVREAVQRLQEQGWVRVYPKRGIVVASPEPGEYEDVVAARVLLETNGARVALAAATVDELIDRLQESIAKQQTAREQQDLTLLAAADADFHEAIAAAAGNRLLDQTWSELRDRQERMTTRSVWLRPDRSAAILADHRQLLTLIHAGDIPGFEVALDVHIRSIHQDLLRS